MALKTSEIFPRWLQELSRFQSMKSQFFLYGNIYDCHYFPINYNEAANQDELKWAKFPTIIQLLGKYLEIEGYELICKYDIVDLLSVKPITKKDESKEKPSEEKKEDPITKKNILQFLTKSNPEAKAYFTGRDIGRIESNLGDVLSFFRFLSSNTEKLFAGIIDFSSRFTPNPNSLSEPESRHFIKLVKAAQESRFFPKKSDKRNIIILICDKLSDIPTWMLLENPLTQGIELQKPNTEERKRFFSIQKKLFYHEKEREESKEDGQRFPDLTDEFSNHDLENLITLSKQEKIDISEIRRVIDLYKFGVKENFWEKLDQAKVKMAESELKKRVFGQENAIKKSVDVIRRAKLGLHNIDKNKQNNKPKGVLFFAGPTGVGKTELAKSLADLIFSTDDAIIRLDMSEYNDSNSDVKLIGSPPGYVGYEEGGQLTRKMKEKPFSIVLFDEIEKAHPVVFDKFLQILDDGRLTDGKGETVYFSESLIIFTSNLGIYRINERGQRVINVEYEDSPGTVAEKIMSEIKMFFTTRLNRPEILNRFGDNFVVFDFIRPPVDKLILMKNLNTIKANLMKQKKCDFQFDEKFIELFRKYYINDNLINGGRGINNRVEAYIKNGLSNFLFEQDKIDGLKFRVVINEAKVGKDKKPLVEFECIGV